MAATLTNFTVAANSNRVLIVSVYAKYGVPTPGSIDGVTYGTTAMTEVPFAITPNYTNGTNRSGIVKLYYLKDPATGTPQSITATVTGTPQRVFVGAISLYDAYVHGVEPIGNVNWADGGASTTVNTSISTTSNNSWLVDVFAGDSTYGASATAGAGQTSHWSIPNVQGCSGGSTKPVASAGPTSMSWTLASAQTIALLDVVAEIKIAQ